MIESSPAGSRIAFFDFPGTFRSVSSGGIPVVIDRTTDCKGAASIRKHNNMIHIPLRPLILRFPFTLISWNFPAHTVDAIILGKQVIIVTRRRIIAGDLSWGRNRFPLSLLIIDQRETLYHISPEKASEDAPLDKWIPVWSGVFSRIWKVRYAGDENDRREVMPALSP